MIQEKKDGVSCLAIVSFLHQTDFETDSKHLIAPFLIESKRNWTRIQVNGETRGYLCLHIFFPHNLADRKIAVTQKKVTELHEIPIESARLSSQTYEALQNSIAETWNMDLYGTPIIRQKNTHGLQMKFLITMMLRGKFEVQKEI